MNEHFELLDINCQREVQEKTFNLKEYSTIQLSIYSHCERMFV